MGYKGVVRSRNMGWCEINIGLRSHTIAGLVWILNGMSHGTVHSLDILLGFYF